MKIDTTRPSIGRMYDYVLGGHHNFEVDREAADGLLKIAPLYKKGAQLNRWFLNLVATRWAEAGITHVLDLGSGLPTQGHLNDHLPAAQILFSDNDPLTVAHGQEILKDRPHQRYVQAELRQPKPLLEIAEQFFGGQRRVAVGFFGVSYFLSTEEIRELMQFVTEFCAPGSVLAITFVSLSKSALENPSGEPPAAVAAYNRLASAKFTLRTRQEVEQLLAPWRIVEGRHLEEWLEVDGYFNPDDRVSAFDIDMYGLLAVR